ncbi:MAG: phosphoribosyl-AMP cyclohydrolase [Chloroflexota bacterium]
MNENTDLKFDQKGLIPAIIQDVFSGQVLMLGWMNEESIRLTQSTGWVHFWSRSRQQLWKKGETSGHFLQVIEMFADCDRDALLVHVLRRGPVCHTGMVTCFHTSLERGD